MVGSKWVKASDWTGRNDWCVLAFRFIYDSEEPSEFHCDGVFLTDFIFLWLIRLISSSYELGDNRNSLGQSQRAILKLITLLDFITHQPLRHFTCSVFTHMTDGVEVLVCFLFLDLPVLHILLAPHVPPGYVINVTPQHNILLNK